MGGERASYFAPAERASVEQLARDVAVVAENPLVDALLQTSGALLAVLNQERQVLAANHALLRMVGVEDPDNLTGLRPGEVIGCDHASSPPAGCGTTKYCATCGAAISIVGALSADADLERKCVLTIPREGRAMDLCLRVRARVLRIDDRAFVLLFLQDVTAQERLSEVQRTFFHDVRNLLMGLRGNTLLLARVDESERGDLINDVSKITAQLIGEVNLQQSLAGDGRDVTSGAFRPIRASEVLSDIASLVRNHAAAVDKQIEVAQPSPSLVVTSDAVLLGRVLLNMTINALESTSAGGTIRLWSERQEEPSRVRFAVWNATSIPPQVQLRIFQRHFSTKGQWGRGVGTWSMKLIGESFLQGKVGFESEDSKGTTFFLDLPAAGQG
jgi:signal transduction histidine kinase